MPNPRESVNDRRGDALESIAQLVQQQICPLVAIESLDKQPWAGQIEHRPESLFCEISGVAHLFGGEAGIIRAVENLLTEQQISGHLAIADSVGAAWAVSHYASEPDDNDSPSFESVEQERQRLFGEGSIGSPASFAQAVPSPNARTSPSNLPREGEIDCSQTFHIVPTGANRSAIEPLPVEALRIATETAETLSRLGVHHVSQLLRLPRSGLAPRLGKTLVRRIQQALGEIDEALSIYHPPVQHTATHRLEYQTSDLNILADRIERLIKEVRAGMATCQRGALRMTCSLDLTDHPPLTLEVGLFTATIETSHLCELLIHKLETLRLPATVERITLSVPLTGPLRQNQNDLFAKHSAETNSLTPKSTNKEVSRLVNSLSGRLGCDRVVGVKIKDNPLPEQAFSISNLAGTGSSGTNFTGMKHSSVRRGKSWQGSLHFSDFPSPDQAMRRPLCLLSKPISLAVVNENGSVCCELHSTKVPQRIRIGGITHSVVRYWGSERIETSWWNGPSIRRDYYRIELDSGLWWWIFRDLVPKTGHCQWMLHGKFN